MSLPAALRYRGFVLYLASQLFATFAAQIVTVAVGWQLYDLTRDPLDLGIAGLVEFAPAILLVLLTGQAADRFDRRFVVIACIAGETLCVAGLLLFTLAGGDRAWHIFLILLGFGIARAFWSPAERALLPNLLPPVVLGRAIALTSTAWQLASIAGPAAGGLLYGLSPEAAYGVAIALLAASAVATAMIPRPPGRAAREPTDWQNLIGGFKYVWREKVVLGAISLDLFAVLLGGAVALLPVYARDILEVGPLGLGLLRSAPGAGAVVMAAYLTRWPIEHRAGAVMLICVAIFGLATVIFGVSVSPWLSMVALAVMGATDMVSVYVRETLIQLRTPDALRGRVNAVNMMFVGASNEVGAFRAGSVAALLGAVPAVVMGGVGSILIAVLWVRLFPALRKVNRLTGD
jgi:MFS family permease